MSTAGTPTRIGIAVVVYNRRVLVGVRAPNGPLPGRAEFPGGKCRSDESAEDCAVRECQEEAGLCVVVDRLIGDLTWEYTHGKVHLHFLLCHPSEAADVAESHNGFRWVEASELPHLPFPEANERVVRYLLELLT